MKAEELLDIIGAEFYTGVPDSQLKALCDLLIDAYGTDPKRHVIAANEGNAVAMAVGYHLATGKIPVVYMQNSGEGNIINPMASLLNDQVYAIPVVLIIGWRGEPGVHDEPQHIYQGAVTIKLLEDMGIKHTVVSTETSAVELNRAMETFRPLLDTGKSVAFVIRKGALTYDKKIQYQNGHTMRREEAIRFVIRAAGDDPIISTTGKASRELFEIREQGGQGHQHDFLTVGSMGHSSSIALGLALQRPDQRVWCIDGDGAVLMHMGAMAVIGASRPKNLIHIVLNNGAHESVGGMPTVAGQIDLVAIAQACGYPYAVRAETQENLEQGLREAKKRGALSFVEVACSIGARTDLGRPTTSPIENKRAFMNLWQKTER